MAESEKNGNTMSTDSGDYQIKRSDDSVEAGIFSPMDSPLKRMTLILRLLVCALYFKARYTQVSAMSNWISWSILILEFCAALSTSISQGITLLGILAKRPLRPRYELVGDKAPLVSVLITCCGEELNLTMESIRAVSTQDYPSHRYHVFVCDDAANEDLKEAIRVYCSAESNIPGVTYLARKKVAGVPHYYKSGNLRFGFEESARLFNSPFVAAIDIDGLAHKSWLRKTIPHLLLDPAQAMINVRTRNYNIPPGDPLEQATALQCRWVESIRDMLGTAGCSGSGYVLRRSIIDSIGGLPLINIGEDMMLAYTLMGNGKKTGSCTDFLEQDLAPDTMESLIIQQKRWVTGDINLVRHFRYFIPGLDRGRQRNAIQIVSGVFFFLRIHTPVTNMAAIALLPLVMWIAVSNSATLPGDSGSLLVQKLYLASFLIDKINTKVFSARLSGQSESFMWMSLYRFQAIAAYYLPWSTLHFHVTGTTSSSYNERSPTARAPLAVRLLSSYFLLFFCYSTATACLLLSCISKLAFRQNSTISGKHGYYTAGFVWILEFCFKMSIPWRYMLWPPNMPERKVLLKRAKKNTAVALKKEGDEAEQGLEIKLSMHKIQSFPWLVILEVIVVFLVDWSGFFVGTY